MRERRTKLAATKRREPQPRRGERVVDVVARHDAERAATGLESRRRLLELATQREHEVVCLRMQEVLPRRGRRKAGVLVALLERGLLVPRQEQEDPAEDVLARVEREPIRLGPPEDGVRDGEGRTVAIQLPGLDCALLERVLEPQPLTEHDPRRVRALGRMPRRVDDLESRHAEDDLDEAHGPWTRAPCRLRAEGRPYTRAKPRLAPERRRPAGRAGLPDPLLPPNLR